MKPYVVLYVQPVGEKGGMEVNLVNEIRLLDRNRFWPVAACLEEGPIAGDLRSQGVPVQLIRRGRLRNLPRSAMTVYRLLKLIRDCDASLVVSQNSYAHIYARPAAALAGKPAILRTGGVSHPLDRTDRAAFALGASAFIANSWFTHQALVGAGVPSERVRMVYRGVDTSEYRPGEPSSKIRVELGLSPQALVVTVVGRLQHWKGQHVVIEAAPLVARQFPEVRFLIVGDALFGIEQEYPERLRCLIREQEVGAYVTMLGHRTDVSAILRASDIVVVPSIHPEPFGMVTIEAMATGKPVIASNGGASPEVITHGETGLLVPPNDRELLGEAIVRLLSHDGLRMAMGEKGRNVVRERFTLDRAVREYEGLYLQCLRAPALQT